MKKRISFVAMLLAAMLLVSPAAAMEYTMSGASGGTFGVPTSIANISVEVSSLSDRSKDGALIPPAFGSLSSGYAASSLPLAVDGTAASAIAFPVISYTTVTTDMYYADGSIGELSIPNIGVRVRVYEGTDSTQLAKGVGHFSGTSIWSGNVALAGHNRGVNSCFGKIHMLSKGDIVTLTTRLGTRTYAVSEVRMIGETDSSVLSASSSDCLTLITCVSGQSDYRWCVRATKQE